MRKKSNKTENNLFHTLMELRGNPRACLYTEPMWGLSMNLCLPYMSVYMLAFGLHDVQVGIVSSVYMFSQMIFSFLAGAIVDKMGRRKSTVIFDFLDACGIHTVTKDGAHHKPYTALTLAAFADEHEHLLSLGGWDKAISHELLQGQNILRL